MNTIANPYATSATNNNNTPFASIVNNVHKPPNQNGISNARTTTIVMTGGNQVSVQNVSVYRCYKALIVLLSFIVKHCATKSNE
jgi:hypothetical protein